MSWAGSVSGFITAMAGEMSNNDRTKAPVRLTVKAYQLKVTNNIRDNPRPDLYRKFPSPH